MIKKTILFIIITLLFSFPALADWVVDFNEDGCVDDSDLQTATDHLDAMGTSEYDVNSDQIVDDKDLIIIQAYLDRGSITSDCDGFKCEAETCNSEDDDCDGLVDEDSNEEMCSSTQTCLNGNCVIMAGACVDSDGYDIYTKGNSIGETQDGFKINQNEACYEVDIYKKLKVTNECFGNNRFLHEYECNEADTLIETKVNCEYGCKYGKCRKITKRCNEEDEGLDILKLSNGNFEEKSGVITPLKDYCKDTNNDGIYDTLVEYECNGEYDPDTKILIEEYKEYEIICSCEDGICNKVKNGTCIDTDGNDKYTVGYTKSINSDKEILNNFDYCMIKTNDGFENVDKCTGEKCHLTEYHCSNNKVLNKFVHECPLGCVNGFCIGTECAKDEIFVLNEGQVLTYDDKCEISINAASDKLDKPSNQFNQLKDFACCSETAESYCVFNGKCYSSSRTSNYYELNNETVACGCTDSTCSFSDGNHVGLWYDLDSSKGLCEGETDTCNVKWYSETEFKWIKPGLTKNQEDSVWEFENNNPECCGDDSGEFIVCDNENNNCICCDNKDASYNNGKCGEIIKSQSTEPENNPQTINEQPKTHSDTQVTPILDNKNSNVDESNTPVNRYSWKLVVISIIILIILGTIGILILRKKENANDSSEELKEIKKDTEDIKSINDKKDNSDK